MNMKKNVMIVDDDAHVRVAVRTVLEEAGFRVFNADSGKSCVDHLKAGFKGLILLDIMMPDMDGWDTISAILAGDLFHEIGIVMLTAKDTPDNKMIGLQEWILDYLTKPFESDDLIQKCEYYAGFIMEFSDPGEQYHSS